MRTFLLRNPEFTAPATIGAFAALIVAASGCGDGAAMRSGSNGLGSTIGNLGPIPTSGSLPSGAPSTWDLSYLMYRGVQPATLVNAAAIYSGTLYLSTGATQPYQIQLGQVVVSGTSQTYMQLNFVSDHGAIGGPWQFSSVGRIAYPSYTSDTVKLSFSSDPQNLPGLNQYEGPYASSSVEIVLALRYGSQFIPTQSKIIIKDCGSSHSTYCSYPLTDRGGTVTGRH